MMEAVNLLKSVYYRAVPYTEEEIADNMKAKDERIEKAEYDRPYRVRPGVFIITK